MSEFTALREASLTVAERLRATFLADAQINPLFGAGGHVVSLRTPKEMRTVQPNQVGLSVWLYMVEGNEFLHNRPPERIDPFHTRRAPLPVNLHYLMTPITNDPATEQLILGKVLQALHDDAFFLPAPARPELRDELRISLERVDLESITRVWSALDEPYQLSVSYIVQVVNIESGLEPVNGAPVLQKLSDYQQIVGTP
jgi:hypothetical protein